VYLLFWCSHKSFTKILQFIRKQLGQTHRRTLMHLEIWNIGTTRMANLPSHHKYSFGAHYVHVDFMSKTLYEENVIKSGTYSTAAITYTQNISCFMKFEVDTSVFLKMQVFWDKASHTRRPASSFFRLLIILWNTFQQKMLNAKYSSKMSSFTEI
jgi:hypothetical protein